MGRKGKATGAAIAFLFALLALGVNASDAGEDCKSIKSPEERLKCYDAQATKSEPPREASASAEFQIVDPSDIYVGTRKYLNKPIGIRRVRCYFADVDDYRCIPTNSETSVAFFSKSIEPKSAREFIEKNCDTLKKTVTLSACLVSIRFQYSADDVNEDFVSGMNRRIVIRPRDGITVSIPEEGGRRSRR